MLSKDVGMKVLLDERKLNILELISGNESMSVNELSKRFSVSAATIRTDLDVLAENGKIARFHGGAKLIENRHKQEFDYQNRKNLNAAKKKTIGSVAADFIQSSDSIILDGSSTALAVAQAIHNREYLSNVTIMPFGIWAAIELLGCKNLNIILPGGNLDHSSASIRDISLIDTFGGLYIKKAFLGAWGVSASQGFTDRNLQEVELKHRITQMVDEVIVVVDGSKFGQSGLASYAPINLDNLSKIITDSSAPQEIINEIRETGVEVIVTE